MCFDGRIRRAAASGCCDTRVDVLLPGVCARVCVCVRTCVCEHHRVAARCCALLRVQAHDGGDIPIRSMKEFVVVYVIIKVALLFGQVKLIFRQAREAFADDSMVSYARSYACSGAQSRVMLLFYHTDFGCCHSSVCKRTGAAAGALPEQGDACKLAGVTHARQGRPWSARMRTRAYEENIRYEQHAKQRTAGSTVVTVEVASDIDARAMYVSVVAPSNDLRTSVNVTGERA